MTMVDQGPENGQRGQAYWFLASLVAARPEQETLARMIALADQGEAEDAAAQIVAPLKAEADVTALAERLSVEHTRLFRGIREGYGPPPPYESLWREGVLMGETTVAVATTYLEASYEPEPQWGPPDHLVEELHFLAALCNAETEAWQTGREDDATWSREQQLAFVDRHLMAWLPAYCEKLCAEAREPFYQALGRTMAEVVGQDAQQLRDGLANSKDQGRSRS